jgi:hypothetical protein
VEINGAIRDVLKQTRGDEKRCVSADALRRALADCQSRSGATTASNPQFGYQRRGSNERHARRTTRVADLHGERGINGALVAVRDSGPGLDPKSVDRLFEAFYTTVCTSNIAQQHRPIVYRPTADWIYDRDRETVIRRKPPPSFHRRVHCSRPSMPHGRRA